MNPEHEQRFAEIVERGRIRVDIADALRELIDDVRTEGFIAGQNNMLEAGYQLP